LATTSAKNHCKIIIQKLQKNQIYFQFGQISFLLHSSLLQNVGAGIQNYTPPFSSIPIEKEK
jgi:hypothetical protein